ncbi:unnamed protein product [Lasius platythorax]|uniref:Uncharacterized protein n=1 Tax=Lasius platythorax TaxID=488582 RepID=A0AAV2PCZ1_9HYME
MLNSCESSKDRSADYAPRYRESARKRETIARSEPEDEKGKGSLEYSRSRENMALEARCTLLYGRRIIHTSTPTEARPVVEPGLKERTSRDWIGHRNWIAFPVPWGIKPLR